MNVIKISSIYMYYVQCKTQLGFCARTVWYNKFVILKFFCAIFRLNLCLFELVLSCFDCSLDVCSYPLPTFNLDDSIYFLPFLLKHLPFVIEFSAITCKFTLVYVC